MDNNRVYEVFKSVIPALVVSAAISGSTAIINQGMQGRLLEDNINATRELSKTMTDLRLQLGVFSERYVTREELDRKLSKVGGSHGT